MEPMRQRRRSRPNPLPCKQWLGRTLRHPAERQPVDQLLDAVRQRYTDYRVRRAYWVAFACHVVSHRNVRVQLLRMHAGALLRRVCGRVRVSAITTLQLKAAAGAQPVAALLCTAAPASLLLKALLLSKERVALVTRPTCSQPLLPCTTLHAYIAATWTLRWASMHQGSGAWILDRRLHALLYVFLQRWEFDRQAGPCAPHQSWPAPRWPAGDELDQRRAHHSLKLCVAHSSGLAELLQTDQRLDHQDGLECLRPEPILLA